MRQQTCTTVTLRQRPIRNGRISLYLDYYPAVRNPKTMQLSRREYLGFYIYATPKNAIELDYNNEILAKAELIRCRRQEAVSNCLWDQKTFFKILVKVREKGYESKKICKMCGLIRKITMKTKKKGRIQ